MLAALTVFGVGAAVSSADNVVVTSTTATLVNADTTTALPGISVSGFSDPSQELLVSLSTNIGSLSLSETSGLTLSYGYNSFSGSQLSFTGDQADVAAALASTSLSDSGTTGTATVSLDVTPDQSGIEYLASTGHYYEYIAAPEITWTDAAAAAETYTFDGETGYLAAISDEAVNTFVTEHLDGAQNVWAGGMSVDYPSGYNGNPAIQRVWSWQFGPLAGTVFTECSNVSEECEHTNDSGDYYDWNSGEPNNDGYTGEGTGEHYLAINYVGYGTWNDYPNSTGIDGYVVEFGNEVSGGTFAGSYSASSNVTLAAAPGIPSAVQGTRGDGQATISWSAPSDNGEPITGYTVTAQPGGETCTTTAATSCTVGNLTNGTSYSFTVTASNTMGAGSASSALYVTPAAVPDAPVISTASAGNGQATISWSAPSDNGEPITGYTVTAQPGGETCTTTAATSCTVGNLTNGTSYSFTITATNPVGSSGPSASAAATPATVPGAPTDVTGGGGDGQTTVSWTAPVSDGGSAITLYTVTAQPGGETCSTTAATSCTVHNLTNGTNYSFTITASNTMGAGSASSALYVTPAAVPDAPVISTASAGNGQATISWSAPSDNGEPITGYTVTAQPGGETCTTTAATSCTVGNLTNGTSYSFTITATNPVGSSGPSASAAATPATVPGAPTDVTGGGGDGQTTVSWTAPVSDGGSAITLYTVTAQPGGASCTATAASATSCIVHGLTNGTAYMFTVTATNATGVGPASQPSDTVVPVTVPAQIPETVVPVTVAAVPTDVAVTPMALAGAPTDVKVTGGNGMTTVSWAPPSDDGGTAIISYTVTVEPGGETCTTTTDSCVIMGLANGIGYTFDVTATNAAGTGPAAHTASAMHGAFSVVWHRQRLAGTIYFELHLPGPGTVRLLGTHSDPAITVSTARTQLDPGYDRLGYSRHSDIIITKAGLVHLALHPTTAGERLLRRHATYGMPLYVRVWIGYTPTGGAMTLLSRTVRVLAAHQ